MGQRYPMLPSVCWVPTFHQAVRSVNSDVQAMRGRTRFGSSGKGAGASSAVDQASEVCGAARAEVVYPFHRRRSRCASQFPEGLKVHLGNRPQLVNAKDAAHIQQRIECLLVARPHPRLPPTARPIGHHPSAQCSRQQLPTSRGRCWPSPHRRTEPCTPNCNTGLRRAGRKHGPKQVRPRVEGWSN